MRFNNNSKVCFLGDSFVAQNVYVPRIIDFYEKNFKNSGIRFFSCGAAGGTAGHQLKWLDNDVFLNGATHAVIAFGINDTERWMLRLATGQRLYDSLKRAYDNYEKNINALCDKLTEKGVDITLCTPPPYAEYEKDGEEPLHGCSVLINEFAHVVRNIARERNLKLVDYNKYITEKMVCEEVNFFGGDHIHPNNHGYHHMAKYFLASQGLELNDEEEVPEYMKDWLKALSDYRSIPAVEVMITPWWENKSTEENIAFVQKYVDEKRYRDNFFKRISEGYLNLKPIEEELRKKENEIYMRDIFGHYSK